METSEALEEVECQRCRNLARGLSSGHGSRSFYHRLNAAAQKESARVAEGARLRAAGLAHPDEVQEMRRQLASLDLPLKVL